MRTLVYDPPAHIARQVLIEAGEEVPEGGEFAVSNDRALELIAADTVPVRELERELRRMKRDELDRLAVKAGVDPADLSSKEDVIRAIEHAGSGSQQSQLEADTGEGHNADEEAK